MLDLHLTAVPGSLTTPYLERIPGADEDTDLYCRLKDLEQYDMGFLLLGMSPRRLLRDGRLFDNEQVLPLLLWYSQWDKYCRYWASEVMRQWMIFNPSAGDLEGVEDEKSIKFRDYFFEKYAIPLIEEFRRYVAMTLIYPEEHNAPSGPVDMVLHSFILNTERYEDFGRTIWERSEHVPPPDSED